MNHLSSSDQHPAIFAQQLAELESQFRLFPVNSQADASSWAVLSSLGVYADLYSGVALELEQEGLSQFSNALASLVAQAAEEPQKIPENWRDGLNFLASFLDDMAHGLDSGEPLVNWLTDPRWQRLTSWFFNLQTPFLVMNEIQELLLKWQNSFCDETLTADQELELEQAWIRMREFGDALFQPSSSDSESSLLRWKGFSP